MDNGCPSQELYDAAEKNPQPSEPVNIREREEALADAVILKSLKPAIEAEEKKIQERAEFVKRFWGEPEDNLRRSLGHPIRERVGPRRATLEWIRGQHKTPQAVLAEALGISKEDLADVEAGYARLEVVHCMGASIIDRIRGNAEKIEDPMGGYLDVILFGRDQLDEELDRLERQEQRRDAKVAGLAGLQFVEGRKYAVCEAQVCTFCNHVREDGTMTFLLECTRCEGTGWVYRYPRP